MVFVYIEEIMGVMKMKTQNNEPDYYKGRNALKSLIRYFEDELIRARSHLHEYNRIIAELENGKKN